jgi:hypothetical protein
LHGLRILAAAQEPDGDRGGQRSAGDIDQGVADQEVGQEEAWAAEQLDGVAVSPPGGTAEGVEGAAREGEEGRLRTREEGREGEQYEKPGV